MLKCCSVFLGIIKLQVNTDSQFLIQCITEWLPKWQLNGWKVATGEDVKNKLELMELYEAKKGIDVKWVYDSKRKYSLLMIVVNEFFF